MKFKLIILIFSFFSLNTFAQFSGKTKKLIGTWEYKSGNGFESWHLEGEFLIGGAYRINKLGDTSKVEDLKIRKVNKTLVYTICSEDLLGDTSIVLKHNFVGQKNKMKFSNIESNLPAMISYSFGFLNRNKLKIKIQYFTSLTSSVTLAPTSIPDFQPPVSYTCPHKTALVFLNPIQHPRMESASA